MKKVCPLCRRSIIEADQKCCDQCCENQSKRHKEYDCFRRNKRAAAFYHSPEWAHMAEHIRQVQGGVDLWALYEEHRLVTEELCVHHIIELDEDWSQRLCEENLFLTSRRSHALIHKLYRHNRKQTQDRLRDILNYIKAS